MKFKKKIFFILILLRYISIDNYLKYSVTNSAIDCLKLTNTSKFIKVLIFYNTKLKNCTFLPFKCLTDPFIKIFCFNRFYNFNKIVSANFFKNIKIYIWLYIYIFRFSIFVRSNNILKGKWINILTPSSAT